MSLAVEFVKSLNSIISVVDITNKSDMDDIEKLRERIIEVLKHLERSEEYVNTLLSRLESNSLREKREVIYVRIDGMLRAVVSPDMIKPIVFPTAMLDNKCTHAFDCVRPFETLSGYSVVETEEELRRFDSSLETICLGVFDHTYRSFGGFSCYFAIYIPSGYIYIIDVIKFRDIIPHLRMLTCETKKVIHCQRCVERLIMDFGKIGCYRNFNIPENDLFVDWRISPLDETLVSIVCQDMQNAIEMINSGAALESHVMETKDEVGEFAEKFNLPINLDILADLLRLRTYLARTNDESREYVITDTQIYNLIINTPSSIEELESVLGRMSSLLRLHAGDFLLALRKRAGPFSMESLKSKQVLLRTKNETMDINKYRRFGEETDCTLIQELDDESSFELSAENA